MRNASLAMVLHISVGDALKDVRGLRHSLASRPEGLWLPRLFMADFVTIEASNFSNMADGVAKLLDGNFQLGNSNLLWVILESFHGSRLPGSGSKIDVFFQNKQLLPGQ